MTIQAFITRCERFCETRGVSQVWLSKKLFNDTYRIRNLAAGDTDVGVKRLEAAEADLTALEAQMSPAGADPAPAEAVSP